MHRDRTHLKFDLLLNFRMETKCKPPVEKNKKMRKLYLFMTMSFDGFVAGPNNELDWMGLAAPDPEVDADNLALIQSADTGIMGYPTAIGMIPYWANMARDASASKSDHDMAAAIAKTHGIVISKKTEKTDWDNAELLVAKDDKELVEAVARLKQKTGQDIGIPGGVRTGQNFSRLGLVDEYNLVVHPVAIGNGKRLFTSKVNLELVSSKVYRSGVIRVCFHPK
jgi:dihydrofolate reductase